MVFFADQKSFENEVLVLRKSYRSEYERIADLDISNDPIENFESITQLLSKNCDLTISNAYKLAVKKICQTDDYDSVGFAVIAMGKLGGNEINYLSDIDLIFIGTDEVISNGIGSKIALELIKICSGYISDELPLWDIDTALRPEGKDGPLVRSIKSSQLYYQSWAHNWEFQALFKSRVICGNKELSQNYKNMTYELIWGASKRPDFIQECQKMRERVIANIPDEFKNREIKLGEGGLRDIEFSVQLLQLVHGSVNENIRSRSTIKALKELSDQGYISRDDLSTISYAYKFLRIIEHRLQYYLNKRTHLFPDIKTDEGKSMVLKLAQTFSMDYDEFLETYHKIKVKIRQTHLKLFYRPILAITTQFSDDELSLDTQSIKERLSALGFTDQNAAIEHISALVGNQKGLASRRVMILRQIMPAILLWISRGPSRQYALLTLRKIVEKHEGTPWFIGMLRDSLPFVENLCYVLSHSLVLCDELYKYSSAIERLLRKDRELGSIIDFTHFIERLKFSSFRSNNECSQIKIKRLEDIYYEELSILKFLYLLDHKMIDFGEIISHLTDILLIFILRALDINDDIHVIAMGRYGGKELSFASDIDVVLLCNNDSDINHVNKIAKELKRFTTIELDFELRPEGKLGSLVKSIENYDKYYKNDAQLWEYHALLRARVIGGGNKEITKIINSHRYKFNELSNSQLVEIRMIKAKVETYRKAKTKAIDYKLGEGGISDVEWLVQILQMQNVNKYTNLKTVSTLEALDCLMSDKIISDEDGICLKNAWEMATMLRNYEFLDFQYREDSQLYTDQYLKFARKSREVFMRLFYNDISN